jgi:hypothetical protein
MYSLEIICENCREKQIFERPDPVKIIDLAKEMEEMILSGDHYCRPCQSVLPMKMIVRNGDLSLVVFEKIIIPSDIKPTYGVSPIQDMKDTQTSLNTSPKDIIKNPCLPCTGTGKLQVQNKAHKKEDSFKGVLIEECPMCSGKGYLN